MSTKSAEAAAAKESSAQRQKSQIAIADQLEPLWREQKAIGQRVGYLPIVCLWSAALELEM